MLITLIAMQSLWLIWCEHQQRKQARKNPRQFPGTGLTDDTYGVDLDAPFWPAVLARYRKQISLANARRARTRQAVARLSKASERKLRSGLRRR
jgi:hypothetical protein